MAVSSERSVESGTSSAAVRRAFIEFFKSKGHEFVPSSPVVPVDDPTLLFTNAGMNQFKPIFLGQTDPGSAFAKLKRVANSQKCIRAGGKHNDLDDVGKDTYHHTFFEMLGNWSFGDYFKAEAIEWAWELLTDRFGLDGLRLYATYFEGDESKGLEPDLEAKELWLRHLPNGRVLPGSYKDNFWEMGETGPCGPCSEIHYDRVGGRDAAALVNREDPDVIELWNLVFIQFNRESAETLTPLPARHVDTGLGLERLVSVLLDKNKKGETKNNYDTDLFMPLFEAIQRETNAPHAYSGKLGEEDEGDVDMAYRVIADHVRTLTFAIADGAQPSNEGRGYVLRRILRRAVRFGHQRLRGETGFLSALVPTVVSEMGDAFAELRKSETRVTDIIREEEESFGRTLDKGMRRFEDAATGAGNKAMTASVANPDGDGGSAADYVTDYVHEHGLVQIGAGYQHYNAEGVNWREYQGPFRPSISGEDAFQLYDTYGFPLDLTQMMAEERGLTVDVEGFERCMAEQKERSRAAQKATAGEAGEITLTPGAIARLKKLGVAATDDSQKFSGRDMSSRVRAIWNGADFDNRTQIGRVGGDRLTPTGIVTERTSFYAEMGGQEADTGRINVTGEDTTADHDEHEGGEFKVLSARAFGGYVLHIGHMTRGEVRVGDRVALHIDRNRREPIRANHTATHLLNLGLRQALGEGTDQKGSLVAPDRLRFDFPHNGPVAVEKLAEVERVLREQIERGLEVFADEAPLPLARRVTTLRAVFGEVYPDPVRVVSIGIPIAELLADPENEKWMAYSVELCGGTHLVRTDEAKAFAIVSETGIAKGIRRVEAVTGTAAMAAEVAADGLSTRIREAASLGDERLATECAAMAAEIDALTLSVVRRAALKEQLGGLQDRLKTARKAASRAAAKKAAARARVIGQTARGQASAVVVERLDVGGDRGALQQAMKTIRDVSPGSAVLLASVDEDAGAVAIIAGVPRELVERGLRAGDWVREVAGVVGGKGGGRPEQAQGGGTEVGQVGEALARARTFATEHVP